MADLAVDNFGATWRHTVIVSTQTRESRCWVSRLLLRLPIGPESITSVKIYISAAELKMNTSASFK